MGAKLLIGSTDAEHLAVEVLRREGASSDYWDGNWVICRISVSVGGFTGQVTASLRTDELHRLNEGLKFIRSNLFGTAVLESMEDWISLEIKCDNGGRLAISGELHDQSAFANRLSFELPEKDQSYLDGWIAELDAMERECSIVGRP